MGIQEQRIAEATRRLTHAYRKAGYPDIARQVEDGTAMVVAAAAIADILTEMVWEPPVDPKLAAMLAAQKLYLETDGVDTDDDGVMGDVRAVFDAGIAFAEGR